MKTTILLLLISLTVQAQYKPDKQKKIETFVYQTIVYSCMSVSAYYLFRGTTEQNNTAIKNIAYGVTGLGFTVCARFAIDFRMKKKYGHRL